MPTLSDGAVGLSFGGGFEAGSQRFAFFLDFELTSVEVEVVPGFPMDLFIDDTTLGFIAKF